jgi:hypothetical protein
MTLLPRPIALEKNLGGTLIRIIRSLARFSQINIKVC